MRNPQATIIRRGVTAVGRGLLEMALTREGIKGCSPILCTEPVRLEPAYEPFDGARVLSLAAGAVPDIEGSPLEGGGDDLSGGDMVTVRIFAAAEDVLTIGWMDALLQALSAIPEPFTFELSGAAGRVAIRFAVASQRLQLLLLALKGLFPAIRTVVEERPFPEGIPAVEELAPVPPYFRTQSLLGREGASPLGIVIASIAGLAPEDFGLFQVLLQAADRRHDWHYNLENLLEAERRAREFSLMGGMSSNFRYDQGLPALMEPSATEKVRRDVAFFATLARYAVWTPDEKRRATFMDGMWSAASSVRFGNRNFRRLEHRVFEEVLGPEGIRRMVIERLAHRPGLMLTSQEAATFVHLPNERTLSMFGEIEQRRGLEWAGPEFSAEEAATLGVNEYAGVARIVRRPHAERLQHTYLAGATGMGKSTLMKTLALDDARDGRGIAVIDPHGDLCNDLLARLPEARMRDLVYVSFAEPGYVPRWNPFKADVPSGRHADDVTNAIKASTPTMFGARMAHVFRNVTYVVHRQGGTFEDLADIVGKTPRGEELRLRALKEINVPQVQRFLRDELPRFSAENLDSVRNKLSQLLLEDSLGAMFRQPDNDLHPREWMDRGQVVLINLSSDVVGADHARFLGGLFVSLIHRAALTRAAVAEEDRRPFLLYLDEMEVFETKSIEEILCEGRKYGLGAILAHQESGQLRKELVQALGNCGTRVVFRPSPEDVHQVKRTLLGRVGDADLLSLGRGEAFVASGEFVGSLRTELCRYPVLRNARQAGAEYARDHYHRLDASAPAAPKPQKRTYDTFKEGGTDG